jgi:uncharacterized membrane protein
MRASRQLRDPSRRIDAGPAPTGGPVVAPKLASDLVRGFVILGVSLPIFFGSPFLLILFDPGIGLPALSIATLFAGWTGMALSSCAVTVLVFRRVPGRTLADWLRQTTPRTRARRILHTSMGVGAVSWAATGSAIAVVAVVILAFDPMLRREPVPVFTGIAVVVSSMLMIICAYAVRYAREDADTGALEFPGTEHPRFADYLYFAVQVATTFGPSDVMVRTTRLRTSVAVNSLISFAFNTVIVALLVSLIISTATA